MKRFLKILKKKLIIMENEKIRVLQVIWNLEINGGIQSMLKNQVKNMDSNKVQFDFLVHTEEVGYLEKYFKAKGCKIFRAPLPLINRRIINSLRSIFNNYKFMKSFFKEHKEYSIIHIHIAPIWIKAYIAFIAKVNGVSHVLMHSHTYLERKKYTDYIAKKIILYYSDYYLACSAKAGKWLYGTKKYTVINNGIETSKYIFNKEVRITKRRELNIEGKNVVGHVGRFSKEKNHRFLIEIFNEIYKKDRTARLLLIGDGELKKSIEKIVESYGIEKVVFFLGSRKDTNELYQAMDVFVFPSEFEGLGIATIEAQASGLNIFVSDKIPEDIYITGLVTKKLLKESSQKWAVDISKVLITSKIRRDMSKEVKKSGYDIRDSIKKLEEFYIKIYKN